MKKNIVQALLVSTIASTIIGCASVPYELNPNTPKAFVKNTIEAPLSYQGDLGLIKINLFDGKQRYPLFMISDFSTGNTRSVAIEANRLLRFGYEESSGKGGTCVITVDATLEPNKQYAFIGGSSSQLNNRVLTRSTGCRFGIIDLKTGDLVSRKVTLLDFFK